MLGLIEQQCAAVHWAARDVALHERAPRWVRDLAVLAVAGAAEARSIARFAPEYETDAWLLGRACADLWAAREAMAEVGR